MPFIFKFSFDSKVLNYRNFKNLYFKDDFTFNHLIIIFLILKSNCGPLEIQKKFCIKLFLYFSISNLSPYFQVILRK